MLVIFIRAFGGLPGNRPSDALLATFAALRDYSSRLQEVFIPWRRLRRRGQAQGGIGDDPDVHPGQPLDQLAQEGLASGPQAREPLLFDEATDESLRGIRRRHRNR